MNRKHILQELKYTTTDLGPPGLFVTVFVCASLGGLVGMNVGKIVGGDFIHDYGAQLVNHQIYNSPQQVLELLK